MQYLKDNVYSFKYDAELKNTQRELAKARKAKREARKAELEAQRAEKAGKEKCARFVHSSVLTKGFPDLATPFLHPSRLLNPCPPPAAASAVVHRL